jgi:hypothetical protein
MVTTDMQLGPDSAHADMAELRSSDAAKGDASAPVPLGGVLGLGGVQPSPSLPGSTGSGDAIPALVSLGAVDPGVTELGLLGYPGTLSPAVS